MAQIIQLDNGDNIQTAVSLDDIALAIQDAKFSTNPVQIEGTYNDGEADEYTGLLYVDPNKITVYY